MQQARRLAPRPTRTAAQDVAVAAPGRWRRQGLEPMRGPRGEVRWWERPAPAGDEALWEAVKEVHRRRLVLDVGVSELARRVSATRWSLDRATLSPILNGVQPTTSANIEVLADELGVTVLCWDAA